MAAARLGRHSYLLYVSLREIPESRRIGSFSADVAVFIIHTDCIDRMLPVTDRFHDRK